MSAPDQVKRLPRCGSGLTRTRVATALAIISVTTAGCGAGPTGDAASKGRGESSRPLSSDCELLVGPGGLVARALAFAQSDGVLTADAFRDEVQEGLFQIVVSGDQSLRQPAGRLVDLLDDPPAYQRSAELTAKVRRAASAIGRRCAAGARDQEPRAAPSSR